VTYGEVDEAPRLRRNVLIVCVCVVVAAAALAGGLLAGGSGSQSSGATSGPPSASLDTSFVTPSGTWAIVPMGDLNDPLNTFWQMFFKPLGASKWSLVTPPGVADNGGLAATLGPDQTVAVVFDPSQLLTFSPVAFTSDDGKRWTSGGIIPFGAESVPDAMVDSSSSGVLDAIAGGGRQVESGTGAQQSWSTVLTKADLADSASGKQCRVVSLTALATSANGEVIGSGCARPGVVGIFSGSHTGVWTLSGLSMPASAGDITVLRLSPDGAGMSALVVGHAVAGDALYGIWEAPDGKWSVSGGNSLRPHTSIVSEGFGPNGEIVVETKSARGALGAQTVASGSGSAWTTLRAPPAGAKDVSVSRDGSLDALCVENSTLVDWRLEDGAWKLIESLDVPIQYGSSS
jgi:hypothetical protein